MNDLTESPVHERQRAAAEVLAGLLAKPLPVLDWHVTQWAEMEGQADPYGQARPALAVWAAHLGAPVAEDRSEHDGVLRGRVHATAGGVAVKVWAVIEDAPEAEAS